MTISDHGLAEMKVMYVHFYYYTLHKYKNLRYIIQPQSNGDNLLSHFLS